jgi:hypothetical protein
MGPFYRPGSSEANLAARVDAPPARPNGDRMSLLPPGADDPSLRLPTHEKDWGDLGVFAHIEGLTGEEAALLAIPAEHRNPEQHERLRAITHELDRIFEHLRERARERLA